MKKQGMSIAITILVIATLVISTLALFTFIIRQDSIKEQIYITGFLENIYSKEEQINFYINDMVDNAVSASGKNVELFMQEFKKQLDNYKNKEGKFFVEELSQLESQIREENIEINEDKLLIEFEVTIQEEEEIFSASYTYEKKFEKNI